MKQFAIVILCFLSLISVSSQSLVLAYGKSLLPGEAGLLRYRHWTNGSFNLCGGIFLERSTRAPLNYAGYGADVLLEYASNPLGYTNAMLGWRAGLGTVAQLEREPWVYRDWPAKRRWNYGAVLELALEWHCSETFSLLGLLQQKYLFNPDLGRTRFACCLGLAYHFLGD